MGHEAAEGEPERALRFLARTAGAFTSVHNLQDLITRVLESLRAEIGFDSCTVGLVNQSDPDMLMLASTTGLRVDFQGPAIPRGTGLPWAAMESCRPILIRDMHADPSVLWRDDRIRSGIYAQLVVRGRAIGVLSAHRSTVDGFSPEDLDLLTIVGRYLAGAVEVARLYEEAGRRHEEWRALREIEMAITGSLDLRVTLDVILDKVTSQLRVDAADVLLTRAGGHTLDYAAGRGFRTAAPTASPRLRQEYAARAALERRPVIIPDVSAAPAGLLLPDWLGTEGFVAYCATPLIAKGRVRGVLELFHRSSLSPTREWQEYLDTLAAKVAIALNDAALVDELQRSNAEVALAYDFTLEWWSRALDLRDRMTEGHSKRVAELAIRLAQAMGVSEADLVHIRRGALLHDIGKIGIPDSILQKPGPLTEGEWEVMQRHPVYAYELLSPIDYLRPALAIPYCHHEKWDGTGYPRKLRGEEIPLAARMFALADVWDALLSDRPYRSAWTESQACDYIREQAGQHFDPRAADAFLHLHSHSE